MSDVLFKSGLASDYAELIKNDYTFYYTTDTKELYIGQKKITNAADLAEAVARIAKNESDISAINSIITKLEGAENVTNSVRNIAKSYVDALDGVLANVAKSGSAEDIFIADDDGKLDATDLESAITEIIEMIENVESVGSIVSLSTAETPDQGDSTTYILKQGTREVGKIHLAEDLVATSGTLVYEDANGDPGTFIRMTIANGDPFYIDVASLIEYNSVESTAEIALSQNANHQISATIVEVSGSKLTAGSVAKTKLDAAVQSALDLADSAVQSIAEGSTDGTISVDGSDVSIHGLGSAAYTDSSEYDSSGSAEAVRLQVVGNAMTDTVSSKTIEGLSKRADADSERISVLESYVGSGVDQQIEDAIGELDSSKTAASGSVITSIEIEDGKLKAVGEMALTNIARTGNASDASIVDSGNIYNATNVEAALQEVKTIADANATALTWQSF